jgi:hypothetical protein
MDAASLRNYFDTLLDYQFDMLWRRGWGEGNTEFLFAHAVRLLRQDQALRQQLFELIRLTTSIAAPVIDGRTAQRPAQYVPSSFILYAAHATRWPEFKALAASLKGTRDDAWPGNPAKSWSSELLAALADDWEDKEFYEHLRASV